jgi:hypothetical protein
LSNDWLSKAIQYLDEHDDIYFMILRKFKNDIELRNQYNYKFSCVHYFDTFIERSGNFVKVKTHPYTNNPHLRKNKEIYEKGIYPLHEFYSESGEPLETKSNLKIWGEAEIRAKDIENPIILIAGPFSHEDTTDYKYKTSEGCGVFKKMGVSTCKYGFIDFVNQEHLSKWCGTCDLTKGVEDLSKHNKRYEDRN